MSQISVQMIIDESNTAMTLQVLALTWCSPHVVTMPQSLGLTKSWHSKHCMDVPAS